MIACLHCISLCILKIASPAHVLDSFPLIVDFVICAKPLCLYVSGEEPPESLFMKELRRRGMTPTSLLEEKNRSERDEEIKFKEEDGGWSYSRRNGITTGAETNLTDQREKSMALNSEGLEVGGFHFQFTSILLSQTFLSQILNAFVA